MQTTAERCLIKEFWFGSKRMISFWECRAMPATLDSASEGFPSSRCRYRIPSEMAKPGQLQLPHLPIRRDSTGTETAQPSLLLSQSLVCTFPQSGQVKAISGTACLQVKLKQLLLNVVVHLEHFPTCSVHQEAHTVLFSCNVSGILHFSPKA